MKKTATFKNNFKVKTSSDGSVTVEGWANKAVVDRGGDLINMDAWNLDNYKKSGIMLFNHDRDKPIGKMTEVRATDQGLWIKGTISKSKDPFVSYVRDLVSEGILNAFSVGFDAKDEQKNAEGINEIKQAELYEVSVVTLPMNQDSLFNLSSKSIEGLEYHQVKTKVLRQKGAWVAATVQEKIYEMLKKGKIDRTTFDQMVLEKSGITAETLTLILAGQVTPIPEAVLYALSDTLGMDLDELKKLDAGDVDLEGKPKEEEPAPETPPPAEEPAKEAPPAEEETPVEDKPAEDKTAEEGEPEKKADAPSVAVIAIQIPKDAVENAEGAAEWAVQNGWSGDSVTENDSFYLVVQDDTASFAEGQAQLDLGDGVTAIVGVKKTDTTAEEGKLQGDQTPTDGKPDADVDPNALKTKEAIPATQGGEPLMTSENPMFAQARQTNVLLGAVIEVLKEVSTKLDGLVKTETNEQTQEAVPPVEGTPAPEDDPNVAKMFEAANLKLDAIKTRLKQYA